MALERLVFGHRPLVLLVAALLTALLGWHASRLEVKARFEQRIPGAHPFVRNAHAHADALRGLGESVRIVVEPAQGDIFDAAYLQTLQRVNDAVHLLPGVDRPWMRSLWTTSLRWNEVTEEGFLGGPVMPDGFDGSAPAIAALKANVARAGLAGSIVADDLRSSAIQVPLLAQDPVTRAPLDLAAFARALEAAVRPLETPQARIRLVGFPVLVGELVAGLQRMALFFAASVLAAGAIVFAFTRDARGTLLLVMVALLGVVWLLGAMQWIGLALDPFSILVPFLIFAIGLSHGAQKMNGILQDTGRGMGREAAARATFHRLFGTGLAALLANVAGFAVLMVIDIPAIRTLALATSLGVAILVFTKLVLIPVLLSYVGVSHSAARRAARALAAPGGPGGGGWPASGAPGTFAGSATLRFFERFSAPRWAAAAAALALAIGAAAFAIGLRVTIGEAEPGAPELRPQARYNLDLAFVSRHYGLASDPFVVMLQPRPGACADHDTLVAADRFAAALREVEGVQATLSAADGARLGAAGQFEGNPKWLTIARNTSVRRTATDQVMVDRPELLDRGCEIVPIIASLADHRADTLARVAAAARALARAQDTPERRFLLAAGSAGIEAATNEVVKAANGRMLLLLYGAVALLCAAALRSWRAALVALVPLVITSALCEALMVGLGIGIKVATLPVIALGVGVGVDYALYLLSIQLAAQRRGAPRRAAHRTSLAITGRVVALIGCTMAAVVLPWAASPIRFQADMGLLLAFMFLWNVVGALVLVPALSCGLLRRAEAGRP